MSARLHNLACLLLTAALIAAPWLYGGLTRWSMLVLAGILTAVFATWLASVWLGGRLQWIPIRAGMPVVFLIVAGWAVVLVGPDFSVSSFDTRHFSDLSTRWPQSFLVRSPIEAMWMFSGALSVFLLVQDTVTGAFWTSRLYAAMATASGTVVLLGILQATARAPGVFWGETSPLGNSYFGTFFEEGIGVSFINLTWPIAAGGFMGRLRVPGVATKLSRTRVKLSSLGVILGWVGLGVIGSLLGLILGGLIALVMCAWVLWRVPLSGLRAYAIRCGLVVLLCVVGATVGAIASGRTLQFRSHWSTLQESLTRSAPDAPDGVKYGGTDFRIRKEGVILSDDDPHDPSFARNQRRKMATVCVRMIPKAGLLGFGAGTWSTSFPHFTDDALLRTFYLQMQFAYNDYFQAIVEWGILGTIAWGLLFFWGFAGGLYRLRRYRSKGGRIGEKEGMIAGALAGLFGVLLCAWWYFPLQVPVVQLYVAVLLGIVWSAGERRGWSHFEAPQDVVPNAGTT